MGDNVPIDTLKDILTKKCVEYKDRIAFLEKNDKEAEEYEKITYDKLRNDAFALGTVMLKKLNLEGKKIAVIGENSYKWYLTYMSVICGVGVIVPLDKELPKNEILNLINRSKADCIVYSSKKSMLIEELKSELTQDIIYIEMDKPKSDDKSYSLTELIKEGNELVKSGDNTYIEKEIDKEKFAALIFTSGTTAKSKGVMLCHKNLVTNVHGCDAIVKNRKNFVFFSVLPMHHTYEFMASYMNATAAGGCVAICQGLRYISKNMLETKPTALVAVPLLVENIHKKINKIIKEQKKEKLVKNMVKVTSILAKIGIDIRKQVFKKIHESLGGRVEYILFGAAPIDKKIIKDMEGYGFKMIQGYGLTETSPLVAVTSVKNNIPGTVGKALPGVEIRIDLEEGQSEGEIMVRGSNVMLGYYEDEEETKKVLKKGWFYTGDMGCLDDKGNLTVTGRCKNVIVTKNGKNIYPEELEFLVNQIPLVEESMVYGLVSDTDSTDLTVAVKVTLDEEYIQETYKDNRPSNEEIYKIIWDEIKKINRTQVQYKVIQKLEIKNDEFSKTTTLKIKRFEELKKDKVAN